LENNEIRRVFNFYDKEKIGFIKKSDVKFCFLDLKNALFQNKIELNEKLFINQMLDFYSKSSELAEIKAIKNVFYRLLYDKKSNQLNSDRIIPKMVYLGNLAKASSTSEYKNIILDKMPEKKEEFGNGRNDIFTIKSYTNFHFPAQVILNENKLEKFYK